jgi:hypothetical protein
MMFFEQSKEPSEFVRLDEARACPEGNLMAVRTPLDRSHGLRKTGVKLVPRMPV